MRSFLTLPAAPRYRLGNATVPACLVEGLDPAADEDGLARLEITVEDGRIADIAPHGSAGPADGPRIDLDRSMLWPAFVDAHTHLDKGHIWPRRRNPDGTFAGALEAVRADKEAGAWTAEDVRRRMAFSLRCAYAHGTAAIRTHIDSNPPQHKISWPLFAELKQEWAGRITLSGAALASPDFLIEPDFRAELVTLVRAAGGIIGTVTHAFPGVAEAVEVLFRTASENGFDLDFHVDECGDPNVRSLPLIAETAIRTRFSGRILVGHCCSLALQEEDAIDRTLDLMAEAGMAVVSLPMCNMYLQDRRTGRTPRWRGVTLLHEMKARGIPVMVASDNTRDPFYAYGDLDPLEVYAQATRILHLDHPVGDWPKAVTATPADILGLADAGRLFVGGGADFVLFSARSFTELLSRPQADRVVVRGGRAIDTTLPDYRELDATLERADLGDAA